MIFTDYSRIKSAVAFFFLFFLHGSSIGNGQQGISYNGGHITLGWRLCTVVQPWHYCPALQP